MSGGGKRSPHSALSTPTPSATSASAALAHNHSPTATTPTSSLHTQRRQLLIHSIANSNMGDRLNTALPLTPPADHPGGGGGAYSNKVGAPSFATVVSASPSTARSSSTSIYSAQEHAQSSSAHILNKNNSNNSDNDLSGGDIIDSVSTDPPQTIIVTSDAHHRSPSGGSLTSSSRYHSPLASPGGSAGNSGQSIQACDAEPTAISIFDPSNATTITASSMVRKGGGIGGATGSDADPETDSADHDSGESSDDVEIYLDTLGLHDSAARMHVLNASHAMGEAASTSRSSPNNPKPLSEPAHQHSQGQVSVSVSAVGHSSQFGAQALHGQQQVSIPSPTTPNLSNPPSNNSNNPIATLNGFNPNSNSNFAALRVTGPNSVSPSLQQQPTAATGLDGSGGPSIGGPAAKNVLSPLPVPLSVPLSTSPSNPTPAVLAKNNPHSGLQPRQLSLSSYQDHHRQQRHITTPSQGRKAPRAPVYSTIPLPEVDDHNQGPGSSQYDDHAITDSGHQHQQVQLDLDRQHQHHLQLQQQQDQQQMYVHSGMGGSVHGPAEIDVSGLAGLSISGDGRGQQHPQQQFSLGITSSQTLPSISTSGPFDFDSFSNTYSGTTVDLSNPTNTSASAFPTSASDSTLLGGPAAGVASVGDLGLGPKTPNVYINGLPPHFPEDQLFALASPFGEIRSVRTFTRHVRDSESGYGFVLFETIDAAERCIISLRRYRNLHPTFSKQIHKIPGTVYAQGASVASHPSWDEHGSGDSGGSSPGGSGSSGPLSTDASFKARMESLQDPTSTNLYMEGLPLSIDEPTLSALVSPHRISSSRFFQTRLSNPPRIIAFVRLETRAGAEEVIERLHGRMVRGWNDTGSRISVRFADTSEQRELRRHERAAQDGDGSPARLTIAQAALLNLRGQQLRPSSSASPIQGQGPTARVPSSSGGGGGFSTSISAPDFSSNAHLNLPPVIGSSGGGVQGIGIAGGGGPGLDVDYSLAPGRNVFGSRSRSPYQFQPQGQYSLCHTPPPLPTSLPLSSSSATDPAMNALLDSLRSTGVPFQPSSVAGDGYGDTASATAGEYDYNGISNQRGIGLGHRHHHQYHQDQHLHQHQLHLPTTQSLDSFPCQYEHSHPHSRPAPAYTRSGYTATEEYIMRAHAESAAIVQQQHQQQLAVAERRRPAPLDLRRRRSAEDPEGQDYQDPMGGDGAAANIAVGVRAYRAQASIGRVGAVRSGQGLMSSPPTGSASLGMLGSSMSMPSMSSLGGVGPSGSSVSAGATLLMGVSEEDYHAPSGNDAAQRHNTNVYQAHVNPRSAREHHVQRPPMPLSPSIGAPPSNQESSSLSNAAGDTINYQHAAAHMRSTTLPQHRPRDRGHYQQNSMSMPAQNLRTPQHAAVTALSGPRGIDGAPGSSRTIHENEGQDHQPQRGSADGGNGNRHSVGSSANNNIAAGPNRSPMFGDLVDSSSAAHSPSPSLISPTLTYSSQTPSTLSPATPFFGSFNSQTEGFGEKSSPSNVDQHQHHQQPKKLGSTGGAMTPSSLRSLTSEGA